MKSTECNIYIRNESEMPNTLESEKSISSLCIKKTSNHRKKGIRQVHFWFHSMCVHPQPFIIYRSLGHIKSWLLQFHISLKTSNQSMNQSINQSINQLISSPFSMHSPLHTSCNSDTRLIGRKSEHRSRSGEKGRETPELWRLTQRHFRQLKSALLESLLATKNANSFQYSNLL